MTEEMRKAKSNMKVLCIAWGINGVYTTITLWLYFYFKEIGHWSQNPLEVMMGGGFVIKAVLSFWLLGQALTYSIEKDAEKIMEKSK